MDYSEWIERERRIRIRILFSSLDVKEKGFFRICTVCGEICLCHENNCPNCDSPEIRDMTLVFTEDDKALKEKIRCNYRFINITKKEKDK